MLLGTDEKTSKLEELEQKIIAEKVGGRLIQPDIKLVMGSGNIDAKVMFVGEAPGRKENEEGLPFVGASGKLLNELLLSIKLPRSEVYITNIVKYRPPDNRDPSNTEKKAFQPFLLQQIDIIGPDVVCPLGRHATSMLTVGKVEISKLHGTAIKSCAYTIVPLYHPAAAMYDPRLRATLFDDFQKLKDIVNSI